jgi:6-phosphofructokinase
VFTIDRIQRSRSTGTRKLGSIHEHRAQYERLTEVFRAHDICLFFYNGGGHSQDTTHKVSQISAELGEPIVCVGIPKTVKTTRFAKRRSTWRR